MGKLTAHNWDNLTDAELHQVIAESCDDCDRPAKYFLCRWEDKHYWSEWTEDREQSLLQSCGIHKRGFDKKLAG